MHDHHHHTEEHLESSDFLTDVVIGMSDGLTVPFALAAGLTGAVVKQLDYSDSRYCRNCRRKYCNGIRWISCGKNGKGSLQQ